MTLTDQGETHLLLLDDVTMYVVKRSGKEEPVHFDKITARIMKLAYGLNREFCDPVLVAQKVTAGVYKGVKNNDSREATKGVTGTCGALGGGVGGAGEVDLDRWRSPLPGGPSGGRRASVSGMRPVTMLT